MSPPKPPWITTIDGTPEAFKPLSKEEAEKLALEAIADAQRLGDGQGAQFLTADQKFLLDAERRREHHKRNAELFAGLGDAERETFHRKAWAEAATKLGKFDEAKEAAPLENRDIDAIRAACLKPDDEDCGCDREVVETEKGAISLDRRFAVRRLFSPIHNSIVTLWQCRHCGCLNATPTPPERQAGYETNRAKQFDKKNPPKALSDAEILK